METTWIASYGLAAVFVGTLLEGETVLFAAGAMAAQGLLPLPGVIVMAWLGSSLGHVIWFTVGRLWGRRAMKVLRVTDEKFGRVDALISRNTGTAIVMLQYLYGLRLAGATILGVTGINARRFVILESLNCAVWATLVAGAGFLVGGAAERFFQGWARWASIGATALVFAFVIHAIFRAVERRVDEPAP